MVAAKAAAGLTSVSALLAENPDLSPDNVKPGWTALLIVIALFVAVCLPGRSMSKHLKKVTFDEGDEPRRASARTTQERRIPSAEDDPRPPR